MTEQDTQVLAFAAVQEVVVLGQVTVLLGDAYDAHVRLNALAARGLLKRERLSEGAPGLFRITQAGLATLASDLPPPSVTTRWRHAIGAGWLWVAAVRDRFGAFERILTAREMRAPDRAAPDPRTLPFGAFVRGDDGVERGRHYPDLLFVADWGRVAFQLQLDAISPRAVAPILDAYARQGSVRVVVFLDALPAIREMIAMTAAELGLTDLVRVQPVAPTPAASLTYCRCRVMHTGRPAMCPGSGRGAEAGLLPTRFGRNGAEPENMAKRLSLARGAGRGPHGDASRHQSH